MDFMEFFRGTNKLVSCRGNAIEVASSAISSSDLHAELNQSGRAKSDVPLLPQIGEL